MLSSKPSRRTIMMSGIAAASGLGTATASYANIPDTDTFEYEVQRTEAEWRQLLSPEEYSVMREIQTEPRHSSPLTTENRPGRYLCKGCDLPVYEAEWKKILDVGWVFFEHAVPNSVLTAIDYPTGYRAVMSDEPGNPTIEAHCRRCGSHLGHIVLVRVDLLHCINGSALKFVEATA